MTRFVTIPLLVSALLASTPLARLQAADEALILARDLSAKSENIAAEYPQFGALTLCVGTNGFMEWTADVEAGDYFVHFLYCSAEPRPCRMRVGPNLVDGDVLGETTGGFMPANLSWKTYGPFPLPTGAAVIRIETTGLMPHLKGLCVSTDREPPHRNVFPLTSDELKDWRKRMNLDGLRQAVRRLAEKHGAAYPNAAGYLDRIDAFQERLPGGESDAADLDPLREELNALRRQALIDDNPLLAGGKLLFIRRMTYQSSHYYTDFIDGCQYYGGGLCVLSLDDGTVTELAPQLAGGIFGRYDLDFDGAQVVFGHKAAAEEGFRIYEVGVDGTGLRQITFPPSDEAARIAKYDNSHLGGTGRAYNHHTDDMHPCYLPDGGICFISTRCERGILCDGPDILTTTTLYRMDGDGGDMRVLSESPVSEASPSVMNDGRILYTRWEYVDKADVVIKCLWAMRPDGSATAEIFGNNITFPCTMLHGRAVPESNHLFAVIGAPHMPAGAGPVIRLDINAPIRTRAPMTYLTPEVDVRSEFGWFHDRGGQWVRDTTGPLYTDAQPLDEHFFLVSHNPDRPHNDPTAWGLYLIDDLGNRVLLHEESETSCWQPMPLRARRRPPVLPSTRASRLAEYSEVFGDKQPATVMMSDVYAGLEGVPRGTIKYLRIMETGARPWSARHFWDGDSAYQQHAVVSMNASLHIKRTYGVVAVASDGSAHFRVPADRNVFFQALDEDFMEVQRMRTFVNFRPGETRACIGCHEQRQWAPQRKPALAMLRAADNPTPQPGDIGPRPIDYACDVQGILDAHCVECHGDHEPDGDLDLGGQLTTLFNRSYENLVGRELVKVWRENDPKTGEAAPIPPYTLGSHASPLVRLLCQGHEGVELSRAEFLRIVTWVDANAPYYGSYYGRRNLKYRDHPDFRPTPTMEMTRR